MIPYVWSSVRSAVNTFQLKWEWYCIKLVIVPIFLSSLCVLHYFRLRQICIFSVVICLVTKLSFNMYCSDEWHHRQWLELEMQSVVVIAGWQQMVTGKMKKWQWKIIYKRKKCKVAFHSRIIYYWLTYILPKEILLMVFIFLSNCIFLW